MKLEQIMQDWNKDSKALVAVHGVEKGILGRFSLSSP
mgnify:CR=1 FL=1